MNKNNYLPWLIFIAISALIIGGVAGYYYSAINDLTQDINQSAQSVAKKNNNENESVTTDNSNNQDLIKYTNDKYNYSLYYPKDWGLIDYAYDNQNDKIENKWDFVAIDENQIPANSIPYASEMPDFNLVISAIDQLYTINDPNTINTTISIDGTPANQYIYTEASELTGQYYTIIQFEKNNQAYNISILNSDAAGTHPEKIDDIVSSINFN